MSIPASEVVQVNPSVLGGGGAAVSLTGLMLTNSTAIPIGTVQAFASQPDVSAFFGPASTEATLANNYFLGYDNATAKPGNLLFAQYPAAPVAGYLRGGKVSGLTLAQLQALAGTLTVTVDGTPKTSSAINLTAATSFSNAATIILAAFTTPNFTFTYDAQRGAFVATSSTTGAASIVSFGSGTISAGLLLTAATGAVTSAGAIAATPSAALDAITGLTLNWASFMTVFEPVLADKMLFAAWCNGRNKRFSYVAFDTDAANASGANPSGFGAQVTTAAYNGIIAVYGAAAYAAAVMGFIASIDFARTNGRITTAFKAQGGLAASVSDSASAANLRANGYNYFGAYATANDSSIFLFPGKVSGSFVWIDAYVDQIQLNSSFQSALLALLTNSPSIPYNANGKSLTESALLGPISAAVNFGSIRSGVALSPVQINQVNSAAGAQIDTVLSSRGWYLQILDASVAVRAARGSFPITFWYMDGGSVQNLNMASIAVQ